MARGNSKASSEYSKADRGDDKAYNPGNFRRVVEANAADREAGRRQEMDASAYERLRAQARSGTLTGNKLREVMELTSGFIALKQQDAYRIAEEVHKGQTRRDGKPYITHVRAVADQVNGEAKVVAWLHDAMEDGGVTAKDLREQNFPERIIEAVEALTKAPDSKLTYLQYIEKQVKPNELARQVKLADLRDNMKDNDNPEQLKRYRKAYDILAG